MALRKFLLRGALVFSFEKGGAVLIEKTFPALFSFFSYLGIKILPIKKKAKWDFLIGYIVGVFF